MAFGGGVKVAPSGTDVRGETGQGPQERRAYLDLYYVVHCREIEGVRRALAQGEPVTPKVLQRAYAGYKGAISDDYDPEIDQWGTIIVMLERAQAKGNVLSEGLWAAVDAGNIAEVDAAVRAGLRVTDGMEFEARRLTMAAEAGGRKEQFDIVWTRLVKIAGVQFEIDSALVGKNEKALRDALAKDAAVVDGVFVQVRNSFIALVKEAHVRYVEPESDECKTKMTLLERASHRQRDLVMCLWEAIDDIDRYDVREAVRKGAVVTGEMVLMVQERMVRVDEAGGDPETGEDLECLWNLLGWLHEDPARVNDETIGLSSSPPFPNVPLFAMMQQP